MAYLFGLAIECGHNPEQAASIERYFQGYQVILKNTQPVTFTCQQHKQLSSIYPPKYWVFVFVNEYKSGAATKEIAERLTEIGHSMQNRLRSAPPFRFAITGVEPLEAISYEDIIEILQKQELLNYNDQGLIISEDLVSNIHQIKGNKLHNFTSGYLWIPYHGERSIEYDR